MKQQTLNIPSLLVCMSVAGAAFADEIDGSQLLMDHSTHLSTSLPTNLMPTEGGQSAFSAIQEIVEILINDPETDWNQVSIEVLRQHLVDMHNVTVRAELRTTEISGGARFTVTSADPTVSASITRMVLAHSAVTDGTEEWNLSVEPTENGAILIATGNTELVRALGFFGIMTFGVHHQSHHLALAQGIMPH